MKFIDLNIGYTERKALLDSVESKNVTCEALAVKAVS